MMSDEFEVNVARDTLLKAARKHVTDNFGPILHEHEVHGPNTVPVVKAVEPRVFYVPEAGEIDNTPAVTVVMEHGARIVTDGVTYTLRYGYRDGHFSYKFSVSRE
jgi:hypothetical protein